MKYCPYCGATLVGSAVSFCAECGVKLPSTAKAAAANERAAGSCPTADKNVPLENLKPARPAPPLRPGQRRNKPKNPVNRRTAPAYIPAEGTSDDGYDGYYDYIEPIDGGHTRNRRDPEIVKRVILLAMGALIIITLSVFLMYLL